MLSLNDQRVIYSHLISSQIKHGFNSPFGQKNTLAEYMILFGADNRPPMLDKDLYDSCKSRMELYMKNKEHRIMILESVEHGPLIWPTIEENRVTRTKKYSKLSATEKIQAECDMKATNIILQAVQDTNPSTQQDAIILSVFEELSNQVTNCNKVNNDNLMANETLSAEIERFKERVKSLEERQNVDLGTREKLIIDDIIRDKDAQFADFEKEINSLKQTLSKQLKEKNSLTKTFNVFKNESQEKEVKNIDNKIALEKKVKELDNIVYKLNTLILEQSASSPVKIKAPRELSKVSLVNTSLKKLKYHLGQFDNVVKKRITSDALIEGEWGFEHTKAVFLKEIIPFVKTLKDILNVFDKDLLNEVTEVLIFFNQMEAGVQ
ncbi:hypothetical protein Tco_1174108 [Tanacetum coccineum]